MSSRTGVYLEVGARRVFASAADWPGWSRGGKNEKEALEALATYAPRYARVVKLPRDATDFEVVECQKGNATTDYGVPAIAAKAESKKLTAIQTERQIAILEACWKYLDQVRAKVPQELRKGPRGGGRDRDKMYAHVLDAELAYASAMRVKLKEPDRKALLAALRKPNPDAKWPVAYTIRRIAWHALDHAWEMEDRVP